MGTIDVCIGCYASYNAGHLVDEWISLPMPRDKLKLHLKMMRRYTRMDELVALADEVLALLGRSDFAGCSAADRKIGLSGLVSALCRFEEYQGSGDVIARAADRDAAGRVLGALYGRRLREGEYRDAHSDASGQVSASLFNGICGIGYEMLRYAHPRDVLSIL